MGIENGRNIRCIKFSMAVSHNFILLVEYLSDSEVLLTQRSLNADARGSDLPQIDHASRTHHDVSNNLRGDSTEHQGGLQVRGLEATEEDGRVRVARRRRHQGRAACGSRMVVAQQGQVTGRREMHAECPRRVRNLILLPCRRPLRRALYRHEIESGQPTLLETHAPERCLTRDAHGLVRDGQQDLTHDRSGQTVGTERGFGLGAAGQKDLRHTHRTQWNATRESEHLFAVALVVEQKCSPRPADCSCPSPDQLFRLQILDDGLDGPAVAAPLQIDVSHRAS